MMSSRDGLCFNLVERTESEGKPAFYVLQKTVNIPGLEPKDGNIRMQQLCA